MATNQKTNEKLNKIWHFIAQYQQEHGYSPSYSELAEVAGVTSKRGVSIQLKKLEEKKLISRSSNSRRAIKILGNPSATASTSDIFVKLPILGEVVAGEPRYAEQNNEGYLSVSLAETRGTKDAFLLKVDGNSMNKLGYETGDFAIVIPQSTAMNGDVVIAFDPENESATVKRYKRADEFILLIPESYDPKFKPIVGNGFVIQGKVLGRIPKDSAVYVEEV